MPGETKKRVYSPKVETRLSRADVNRLDEAARLAGQSRSDFIRQGVLWYLDNLENLKEDEREGKTAQAIRYATDQIVKAMNLKNIPVTYVLFHDEGHGFARPENRLSFYAITETFLAQCLGGRAEPIGEPASSQPYFTYWRYLPPFSSR